MWLHVLLLTSHKLKWYFDDDQFTATIIFFMLGLGEVCNEDFLDSVKDVPVLSIHHFLSPLVKLHKCDCKHDVTLFSLRNVAIILFVSCTIVFGKTKGINLIHSFRTIVQQRKQHSRSQESCYSLEIQDPKFN